jgi:hypothetical protein
MRMIRAFLAAVGLLLAAEPAAAQSKLFSSQAPLQLTLTAPLPALVRSAKTRMDPFPATLAVAEPGAAPLTLAIEVKPRGISRRIAGFCSFPPLQLRFADKAALKGSLFKGQNHLKLVTYCQDHDDYEQRIMLEYLAYRLYATVTPLSYRVRPAQVTYRTTGKADDKGVTRFGYLIEDIDDLADQNGMKVVKLTSHQISAQQFDQHAAARAAMFEFMVSNLDWDFLAAAAGQECCHNSRFVAVSNAPPLKNVMPLIYDFDFSGFVDAPYSGPPVGIPVQSTRDRYYRGYCASTAEVPAVIAEFKAHRAEMMALIDGQPGLEAKTKLKATRYLESFFTLVDDPGKVQAQIVKHCR